jgi:parallel beta-helix repeat protein
MLIPNAKATIRRVPIDYPTIQAAINAAYAGDIIYVYAGIYYESVNVYKTVRIEGENPAITYIDGSGRYNGIVISADNVTVTGFTIQNAVVGAEIDYSTGNILIGNIFKNNAVGVELFYAIGNTVKSNEMYDNGGGIKLYSASRNDISGNYIHDNINAIYLYYSYFNNIYGNHLEANDFSELEHSDYNIIDRNVIIESNLRLLSSCNNVISGNNMSEIFWSRVLATS